MFNFEKCCLIYFKWKSNPVKQCFLSKLFASSRGVSFIHFFNNPTVSNSDRRGPHSSGTGAGSEEFRKFQVLGPQCRDPLMAVKTKSSANSLVLFSRVATNLLL